LALDDHDYLGDLALCRVKNSQGPHCDSKRSEDFYRFRVERTQPFLTSLENGKTQLSKRAVQIYEYRAVRPGKWAVHYFDEKDVGKKDNDKAPLEKEAKSKQKEEGEEIEMKQMKPASAVFEIEGQGGVYTLALTGPRDNVKETRKKYSDLILYKVAKRFIKSKFSQKSGCFKRFWTTRCPFSGRFLRLWS
jgi:hypothetical protein